MSYELGLKGKLDTAKQDLTLPKTILENISNELKAETDGEIEGMVLPYKGPIQSYTKKSGLAMFGIQTEQEVDIQDSLGAVGNKIERFEFCIAAQSFKEFRIEYDLSVYPVTVVLEENISRQLKDKASLGYIVICKNREEFESIVVGAIKTQRGVVDSRVV